MVDSAYQEAGITRGASGHWRHHSHRRSHSQGQLGAIADLFAAQRGNFVCASAGHNFEALLSAHGSGAVALSAERQCRVLNIDIGGGTTKLTVAEKGKVLSTAAFHVGGPLLAVDDPGISVLEPGGQFLARQVGFQWQIGDHVTGAQIEKLADHMARVVLRLTQGEDHAPELERLWLTPALSGAKNFDAVVFSGGVGRICLRDGDQFLRGSRRAARESASTSNR